MTPDTRVAGYPGVYSGGGEVPPENAPVSSIVYEGAGIVSTGRDPPQPRGLSDGPFRL